MHFLQKLFFALISNELLDFYLNMRKKMQKLTKNFIVLSCLAVTWAICPEMVMAYGTAIKIGSPYSCSCDSRHKTPIACGDSSGGETSTDSSGAPDFSFKAKVFKQDGTEDSLVKFPKDTYVSVRDNYDEECIVPNNSTLTVPLVGVQKKPNCSKKNFSEKSSCEINIKYPDHKLGQDSVYVCNDSDGKSGILKRYIPVCKEGIVSIELSDEDFKNIFEIDKSELK